MVSILLRLSVTLLVVAGVLAPVARAADRFPRPEFVGGHEFPVVEHPPPGTAFGEYADVAALAAGLGLAAYFALRLRRRGAIFALMLVSLAWFGFWKRGCVCSVGSGQNVVQGVFDAGMTVPLSVLAFFLLPLLAALLWGRVFCGAVCPLGAAQDLVVLKPLRVPLWLEHGLGLLAVAYLLAAALVAACGSGYLICRLDPFVGFFRLAGPVPAILFGVCFLALGTVVARPYCRFVCPYGVLLRWCSLLSWRRVTVTPDDCVRCRLCQAACPFGAIREPDAEPFPEPRRSGVRRLGWLVALLPILVVVGGLAGNWGGLGMAQVDFRYRLAAQVWAEDAGLRNSQDLASEAFRATDQSFVALHDLAVRQRRNYRVGGAVAGALFGLVAGLKMIGLATRPRRQSYEPDRGACLACGRCFQYCPKEQARRTGQVGRAALGEGSGGGAR
jgi:NAD-dependent dihydropyrimidine dehydrogenase PreA subunit